MASVSSVNPVSKPLSGYDYINGLLAGNRWTSAVNLTFSFPQSASYYENPYTYYNEPGTGFTPFNAVQQAAVRTALTMFASVANVSFSEMPETAVSHGLIRFGFTSVGPSSAEGWSWNVNSGPSGGDIWIRNAVAYDFVSPSLGSYGFLTLLHEIGHSLGLKHSFETSGSFGLMPVDHESKEYTVMSYTDFLGGSPIVANDYPDSLMLDDIRAIQYVYGANFNSNSDATTYSWDPNTGAESIKNANGVVTRMPTPGSNRIFMTLWDGGGIDTYDFSAYSSANNLKIDLRPGADLFTPIVGGWRSNNEFPRMLADVTGDGVLDIVAFGWQHVFVARGELKKDVNGVDRVTFVELSQNAGLDIFTPAVGGWSSNDRYPRMLADVDGDGVLDVVGFGWAHVFVALGNHDASGKANGTFQALTPVLDDFCVSAGGWVSQTTYPRFVTDMNGDGMADLVGFGEWGVLVALATGQGRFGAPQLILDNFGRAVAAGGWASEDMYLRLLGDLNGDGRADIVGFGQLGVYTSINVADSIQNVIGSAYNDTLSGTQWANVITGGGGADTLSGRGGADTFVFTALTDSTVAASDTILDFEHGVDKIDLSQIDAISTTAGEQSFQFIDTNVFTRHAGELNYMNGVVSGDVNGDGLADFRIVIGNKSPLSAVDFVL